MIKMIPSLHHMWWWDWMLCYPDSRKKTRLLRIKNKRLQYIHPPQMRSNSYRGKSNHNHRQWLKLASTRDEVVRDQQPRVSLETWGNSDAQQTKARNTLTKRQICDYRIQQWTKHSCAISVEKAVLYSKPACINTARAPHPHAIMKKPLVSPLLCCFLAPSSPWATTRSIKS